MAVRIASELLRELLAIADASPQVEVCGLLLGQPGRIAAIRPCANVADAPATRFEIDPAALLHAHRAARAGGAAVVGHYHSHPSGNADPSARDAADAAADGALWLIVGGGEARVWRAGARGPVHGRFTPVALHVAPGPVT